MVEFLVIINVVFLITYILYTTNNKVKYGRLISKKQNKIFNIILLVIFIAYVFLQTYFIYNMQPSIVTLEQLRENKDILKTSGNRLWESIMFLIFSPIFWITLFNLYKEVTETFFRKKHINSNRNSNYYRGTLENVSPAIVSFILENNINLTKAITADVLKLQLKGYIIEEKDTLRCSNLDTANLSKSDKILMDAIKKGNFSDKEYVEAIEQEEINLKLIKKHKNKFEKVKKIFLSTIPRLLILVLLICAMIILTRVDENLIQGVRIFTMDDFKSASGTPDEKRTYYKARYIKVDEKMYNELKEKREKEISKLVEKEKKEKQEKEKTEKNSTTTNNSTSEFPKFNMSSEIENNLRKSKYRMQDLKDQLFFTNILGDHYVKASFVSVGIVSLDTLITIVETILTALLFISIVSMANIIRFIIISSRYSNKYTLTNKGIKLRKEIKGLKKYLKDYSLIKTRTKEEVAIWEYYLIYAVVLNENFEIENDIIKTFVKQIYNY